MLKRATAVTLPLALAACASAPGPYSGEVPTATPYAEREFGEAAKVVTTDTARGVPVEWEVRVSKSSPVCFLVTLTPTFIGEYPQDYTVALPRLEPVAGDEKANFLTDASACGEPDTPLSGYVGDLEVGKAMQVYAGTWTGDGIPATGLLLTTPGQKVRWEEKSES